MKLWEKGIKLNQQIENFTVGDDYLLDQKLVRYDCLASIAHAKMLGKIGILREHEVDQLEQQLVKIIELDQNGEFKILKEQEDCHTAIENYLVEHLGELGKKIHTARSRNDQVLTALRLYYKDQLRNCRAMTEHLIGSMAAFLERYGDIKCPGYTHTRKAMPSSMAMWGSSFIDSMNDNLKMLDLTLEIIDQCPLGTGAGYGVPLPIDRNYTAELLGFKKVQTNPIYSQNSRGKFESAILHVQTLIMFDLNKIASDLVLFSLPELGYFELPDEFCTGSSIMPHKKNPDVLELIRAQYHIVVSCEFQLKNIPSNLISGYHRDIQLTKEPIMKAMEITQQCLTIMSLIFTKLKVNKENCNRALTEEIYATAQVYELVEKGIPFREAYEIVAKRY